MVWFILGIFAVAAMLLSPYGRKLLGVASLLIAGLVVLGLGFVAWSNAQQRKTEIADATAARDAYIATPTTAPAGAVPVPLYIKPVTTATSPPVVATPEKSLTDEQVGLPQQ